MSVNENLYQCKIYLLYQNLFVLLWNFSVNNGDTRVKGVFLVIVVYKTSCNFCVGFNVQCFRISYFAFYCCIFKFNANLVKLRNYYLYILRIPANKYIAAMHINLEDLYENENLLMFLRRHGPQRTSTDNYSNQKIS